MSQVEMMFQRYGPKYKWLVTLTMLLGLVALGMSITIVNVATPYIKGSLGLSDVQVQWISTGFLAATTVALLIAPWLVRSFGQRATFIGLLGTFVVASIIGGLATSMAAIVAARVIQGAMTGLIRPLALEAMFSVFPANERGMATAIYGMCLGLPLTLATVIGGWLVETFTWRYVFFVTPPMCIAAMAMGYLFLPTREESGPRMPFDWTGAISLFVCIFALLAALSNGQRWGWDSSAVLGLFALSLVLGVGFVWWERRVKQPLLDLGIFRHRAFLAGCLAIFVFGGAFYAIMYLLPLFSQTILHYRPVTAGLLFLPSTLVLALLVPVIGKLSDRYPAHYMTLPGLAFAIFAVYLFSRADAYTSFGYLALALTLMSAGMASFPPPTLSRAIGSLPVHLTGYGSGVINFTLQMGGAFGTAALVLMMDRRISWHGEHISTTLTPGNEVAMATVGRWQEWLAGLGVPEAWQQAAALQKLGATEQFWATVMAYQDGFWLVMVSLTFVVIPAWLLSRWTRTPQHA
ncbi:drug resistance transporter, EmrB/QacA subfamily [Marinobacter segnicrescens]|uniref:Drug resistance transporter, EmrB/QacA subfamily n=1 Tax=Marinobacter segnicrescens TaxID=430453 RepID=A0A1I0HHJ3_9GAMM|nr:MULTISPECIES: DHA2 family efflux MFS transporter permease subunit [Marinobacter]UZD65263.1 DHA2 family efflux MFS transporter permease subunit [Marinobacter sp. AN1]SET83329.1 drug resistance transporter, EmrB/QacA subfamily [Marinobacter segnicrescens]